MARTTRASAKTKTAKPPTKAITKDKPASKTPKNTAKPPVAPKKVETARNKRDKEKEAAAVKD